jgi:DNA-binding NarL/FixJ family response regulator
MAWRILIVDDHEIVRIGIKALLAPQKDIAICSEARDGREALAHWRAWKPDIVILDDEMPILNGLVVAQTILRCQPTQRIVVFGSMLSDLVANRFLQSGIRSLLWKADPASDLLAAVRAAQENRVYFTRTVDEIVRRGYLGTVSLRQPFHSKELTLREQEIVQLVAEGRSTNEIALALNISIKTAETHRQNAMVKLGLHNVAQLTRYAIAKGIVQAFMGTTPACLDSGGVNLDSYRLEGLSAAAKAA